MFDKDEVEGAFDVADHGEPQDRRLQPSPQDEPRPADRRHSGGGWDLKLRPGQGFFNLVLQGGGQRGGRAHVGHLHR